MANEIGRRKVRADGSAEKLEHLLRIAPDLDHASASTKNNGTLLPS
jgi:hypothetical protein